MNGLTDPAPQQEIKQPWWRPNVNTEAGARKAIRQAFWVLVLVAAVTGTFAAYAAFSGTTPLGVDPGALIEAIAFGILAIFVFRGSRVATILALALYATSSGLMLADNPGVSGIFVRVIFTVMLVNGVRGSFALRRQLAARERAAANTGFEPPAGA